MYHVDVYKMRVAIIGAGAAGLCCARHFSRFPGKFHVQVFEQTSKVGGTWVYSENTETDEMGLPIHSSMYKNLRTNLPKEIMPFSGFPFDPDLPSYISHWDMVDYLRKYTAHYNLTQFIKFRTRVEHVTPVELKATKNGVWSSAELDREQFQDDVKWTVTTRDLVKNQWKTEDFDYVLVCNGHYFMTHTPDITGLQEFPGTVIHSHSYRDPASFKDLKVLIVGAGPSGQDIMLDLANHANTVYLSNRGSKISCKLPANIEQLPTVSSIRGDGMVCFVNQEERQVDSIILCTGYEFEFPFLAKEAGIRVENNRILSLYKHSFNALHPSMAFIGVYLMILPWPLFEMQVKWILSVWTGNKRLPSTPEMCRDSDEDYRKRLERGMAPYYAHKLGQMQWEFQKELAELAGVEPYPPVLQMMYEERAKIRIEDLPGYKNYNYAIVSESEWKYLPSC